MSENMPYKPYKRFVGYGAGYGMVEGFKMRYMRKLAPPFCSLFAPPMVTLVPPFLFLFFGHRSRSVGSVKNAIIFNGNFAVNFGGIGHDDSRSVGSEAVAVKVAPFCSSFAPPSLLLSYSFGSSIN